MKEIMLICCAAGVFAFLFFVMGRLDCWLEEQEEREMNGEGSLTLADKPMDAVKKGNCRRPQGLHLLSGFRIAKGSEEPERQVHLHGIKAP